MLLQKFCACSRLLNTESVLSMIRLCRLFTKQISTSGNKFSHRRVIRNEQEPPATKRQPSTGQNYAYTRANISTQTNTSVRMDAVLKLSPMGRNSFFSPFHICCSVKKRRSNKSRSPFIFHACDTMHFITDWNPRCTHDVFSLLLNTYLQNSNQFQERV